MLVQPFELESKSCTFLPWLLWTLNCCSLLWSMCKKKTTSQSEELCILIDFVSNYKNLPIINTYIQIPYGFLDEHPNIYW